LDWARADPARSATATKARTAVSNFLGTILLGPQTRKSRLCLAIRRRFWCKPASFEVAPRRRTRMYGTARCVSPQPISSRKISHLFGIASKQVRHPALSC
jgi:hypothetical protein